MSLSLGKEVRSSRCAASHSTVLLAGGGGSGGPCEPCVYRLRSGERERMGGEPKIMCEVLHL